MNVEQENESLFCRTIEVFPASVFLDRCLFLDQELMVVIQLDLSHARNQNTIILIPNPLK